MTEVTAIEEYNDEVKVAKLLRVLTHQTEHHSTLTKACETVGLPVPTFYRWIGEGRLGDAITEMREQRATTLQALAVQAMPGVLRYMIRVATGNVEARGANPISAARLVAQFAGMIDGAEHQDGPAQTFNFYPEQLLFAMGDGRPRLDDQGRLQAIEAEWEEVEG